MLLSNPSPVLHPRPSSSSSFLRLARRSLSSHHHHHLLPICPSTPIPLHPKKPQTLTLNHRHSSILRSQLHTSSAAPFGSKGSLSWPEWAKLVENLNHGGYFGRRSAGDGEDDELAGIAGMPEEFARAASACLAFARDRPNALRLLAKKNIEVIVNGSLPSLFKNGASSERRMRAFLSGDESNALEFERAQTVDIMRYVLDYAYHSLNISEGIKQSNAEVVEASVRNVLAEFVNMSGTVQSSNFTESASRQPPVNHEQFSRPPVKNIEMKRGDWICPKCSFMNFARNMRCLECEEARPKKLLTGREWECPQCDFYNYGRNMSCLRCDCRRPVDIPAGTPYSKNSSIDQILSGSKTDESELEQRLPANNEKAEDFPEIMPWREGANRSVVGTRRTPLERRLANSQSAVSNEKSSESSINESLDRILGRTSTSQNTARTDPGHVPFVPLPPDMFGKPQNTNNEAQHKEDGSKNNGESSDASQRWSEKLAELDNVTDVANAIPDEDFPDIMPMRKGENRFVVSKKKDRSLTSPQYKRRLAMEQANKSDFVPFVPFPPGYFAKKVGQSEAPPPPPPPSSEAVSENSAPPERSQVENNLSESKQSWDSGVSQTNNASNSSIATGGSSNLERGKSQRLNQSGNEVSQSTWGSSNVEGQRSQSSSQSWNKGFTGKSLEGSAVTEPDPLDMSEEAKAARWFRRAAQIKSIEELSQIPDEDFPEIMPMRKGVNRFVVSKRKTPLERRLTSPQYRRNLPIVSSEPEKDSS